MKSASRQLWCCGCVADVQARLTSGSEVYPHRRDLHELPFWICDGCRNHVGCHHKTAHPTQPLGVIPTTALKGARRHIHALLDPLWKNGLFSRSQLYARLTETLGRQYHTADLRSLDEARAIYRAILQIARSVDHAAAEGD